MNSRLDVRTGRKKTIKLVGRQRTDVAKKRAVNKNRIIRRGEWPIPGVKKCDGNKCPWEEPSHFPRERPWPGGHNGPAGSKLSYD